MLWLPITIFVGVVVCVGGVWIRAKRRKETSSGEGVLLLGVGVYVLGVCAGWMFTYFGSPTPADWWHLVALRVAAAVVGTLASTAAIVVFARRYGSVERPHVAIIAVMGAIALLTVRTSVLDLFEGPVTFRIVDVRVEKDHAARHGPKIFSTLKLRAPDGSQRDLDNAGWEAETALGLIAGCDDEDDVDVRMLEHLGRVIDAKCIAR